MYYLGAASLCNRTLWGLYHLQLKGPHTVEWAGDTMHIWDAECSLSHSLYVQPYLALRTQTHTNYILSLRWHKSCALSWLHANMMRAHTHTHSVTLLLNHTASRLIRRERPRDMENWTLLLISRILKRATSQNSHLRFPAKMLNIELKLSEFCVLIYLWNN